MNLRSVSRILVLTAAFLLLITAILGCHANTGGDETTQSDSTPDAVTTTDTSASEDVSAEASEAVTTEEEVTAEEKGTSASGETTAAEIVTTEKPAEVTTKPAEVTTKPAEVTTKPAEVTTKPAEVTTKPAEVTTKPAEVTTKPAEVTTKPAEVTTKPAEVTTKPAEVTTKEPETTLPVPEPPTEPTPSRYIAKNGTLKVTMTEIFKIADHRDANNVHCRVVQGGCTDGTYYYVALNNGVKTENSISAVHKYEIATGKKVATYENLKIFHANDMTYNPVTDEIIVVQGEPDRRYLAFFDRESFELKRREIIDHEIYSLAYDPYENCYWAGLSYGFNFVRLDLDFNRVGDIFIGVVTDYVKQGIDCDDKYIYFQQYKNNAVIVYDKTGAFVREIPLPKTSYEAENIFHIGDVFYIGYYKSSAGGMLYKTTLEKVSDYDVTVTAEEYKTVSQRTDASGNFYKIGQGSCTDGTYLYLMMNNDKNPDYRSSLHKIDLKTGEVVKTVDGLQTGSTNDMTYNPKTNEIVIATDNPDKYKVVILDAATLTVKATKTLDMKIYCIAYDAVRDGYYVGICATYDFAFLDASFKKVGSTVTGYSTGYTKQAMDYDGQYLYFLQSKSNALVVCTPDGSLISVASLGFIPTTASAQNICRVGDTFYIGCYVADTGCVLYKATVKIEG
ncbi:MAG: hypothetical protein J6B77_01750 [Clostridia bacterium]|nr:hypothetical protein [Clostridia bacterium]